MKSKTMNERCVFCGKEILPNDLDGDGEYINHEANIGFVSRIVTAFYNVDNCLELDDWENADVHAYFHIACFKEAIDPICMCGSPRSEHGKRMLYGGDLAPHDFTSPMDAVVKQRDNLIDEVKKKDEIIEKLKTKK